MFTLASTTWERILDPFQNNNQLQLWRDNKHTWRRRQNSQNLTADELETCPCRQYRKRTASDELTKQLIAGELKTSTYNNSANKKIYVHWMYDSDLLNIPHIRLYAYTHTLLRSVSLHNTARHASASVPRNPLRPHHQDTGKWKWYLAFSPALLFLVVFRTLAIPTKHKKKLTYK